MPVIKVSIVNQPKEKIVELSKALAKVAHEVTGIPLDTFTVLIDKYEDYEICLGDKTVEEIKNK